MTAGGMLTDLMAVLARILPAELYHYICHTLPSQDHPEPQPGVISHSSPIRPKIFVCRQFSYAKGHYYAFCIVTTSAVLVKLLFASKHIAQKGNMGLSRRWSSALCSNYPHLNGVELL